MKSAGLFAMKNLVCLLFISLVMLFSCSKDVLNDENPDLKKAKVPIPMKMEVCMDPAAELNFPVENTPVLNPATGAVIIPKLYMAAESWLSGYGTHMGELIKEQSYMTAKSASLDLNALFTAHKVILTATYDVFIMGANGDHITMVSHISIDVTDLSHRTITGDWTITGGSGNFEYAEGEGLCNGLIPCWTLEGSLIYPR